MRYKKNTGFPAGRYLHVLSPENAHQPSIEAASRLLGLLGGGWAARFFLSGGAAGGGATTQARTQIVGGVLSGESVLALVVWNRCLCRPLGG